MLDINTSYHCMQSHGKLMNQTWIKEEKMAKNLVSGQILSRFGPSNFFVGSTSTRCYTLFQAIIVCSSKKN